MLRPLLCVIAFVVFFNCRAQVTMTLQVPAAGVMLKKQLWNMTLVYTGNTAISVKVSMTLSNPANDQPVLTATTGNLTLSTGAKQVQASDLTPIQYTYLSSAMADRDPDGFLSIGSYQACYTIVQNNEAATPLAEDCINFDVLPLSPPLLNTPFNEDTLQTKFPQFTWLPPTPLNLFSNLSYQFNLVEVQPGQNPLDAVQQNIPVYTNYNSTDLFINYPSSGLALDTGRQYAWQIIAQNNLQPVSQSDVWVFRINNRGPVTTPSPGNYILLTHNEAAAGTYTVDNGYISIKYYSFDKAHEADIIIRQANGTVIKTIKQTLVYGNNYLTYPLSNALQKGQLYFIEVTDLQHKKYSASFTIK